MTILDLTTPIACILMGLGSIVGWLLWKCRKWQFRYWLIPVFLCYMLLLIKCTLFPIFIFEPETLERMTGGAGKHYDLFQLIPFASIGNYFRDSSIIQLIGNLILLFPLAVFADVFSRQRLKVWKVALGVSFVSLLIEITQLVINLITQFPSRVTDIDDLILNITGVMLALALTRVMKKNRNICRVFGKILYRQCG